MASRAAFGFRSAKQPEKEDKHGKAPLGLSRKGSITPSTSIASKLPSQSTSFFSRTRKAKPEPPSKTAASSAMPTSREQNMPNIGAAGIETRPATETELAGPTSLRSSTSTPTGQTSTPGKHRNVLRRKAPSIDNRTGYARTESSASSYEPSPSKHHLGARNTSRGYNDSEPRAILGMTTPQPSNTTASYLPGGLGLGSEYATSSSHMASYNNRKPPQSSSVSTLPPPTPTYAQDSGSSTRRSESPGSFSRTSTPTSMSSQSPGVSTPVKMPLRSRTASPSRSRPPITRTRFAERLLHREDNTTRNTGLTAVRESGASSSSSSTLKPESRTGSGRGKPMNTDLPSPRPISPPSRSSSRGGAATQSGFPKRQASLNAGLEQRPGNAVRGAQQPEGRQGQMSASQGTRSRMAPPRPSRDGVPQLDVMIGLSSEATPRLQPSVQITESRGRSSFDAERSDSEARLGRIRSPPARLVRSPSDESSAQLSWMPSQTPALAQPTEPARTDAPRPRALPTLQTNMSNIRSAQDPSTQSAGSSKSSSRFGFFTKHTKSPEKSEKVAKKGPAAGTGHEGYGKYARRGRSGSVATSASRGRSTSSTSAGRTPSSRKSSLTSRDEPELDDFYRDRLSPKAITGGGKAADSPQTGSDLYLSRSAQDSVATLDSNIRPIPTSLSGVPALDAHGSAHDTVHNLRHVNRRLPDREHESIKTITKPPAVSNLASRRSLHRSQLFQQTEPLRIPAPINTGVTAPTPLTSKDGYQYSILQTDSTIPLTDDISEGHEGNWLKSKGSGKPRKSPRRWNFFQRAQASPRRPGVGAASRSDDDHGPLRQLPAAVSRLPESRPVPFYALIDNNEQENTDQGSLGQLPRSSSQADEARGVPMARSRDSSPVKPQNKLSVLLPSPPNLATEFPKPPTLPPVSPFPADFPSTIAEATPPAVSPEPRKPRLQQVGRIPRVISKRDRPHRPPPQSFSRPRPYTPRQDDAPSSDPLTTDSQGSAAVGRPALGVQTDMIPQRPWYPQDFGQPVSAPVMLTDRSDEHFKRDEFLAFPPRMESEVSGSSSSGILSFTTTTAVVPDPGTAPDEDEVWNEYNEFLDTVEAPAPAIDASADPTDGEKQKHRSLHVPLHVVKDSLAARPTPSTPKKAQTSALTYPPAAAAPNRGLPSPPTKPKAMDFPSTPGTISELIAGYGDWLGDSQGSKSHSGSRSSRYSSSSIESEADSLAGREAQGSQPTSAAMELTAAQRLSQIYLRRDALLASRWLSFDRVLFSPAHFEIRSNHKDRVLVLDGLGNDEWSYYCAENYPGAMVYNLSPVERNHDVPPVMIPGVPAPPQNHKHIHHSSLGRPFPFPQGFFAAAVFRFPAATSDAAYFNAISEFKRVLRPGGYLEMSMLDIDMVNMGNITRKALRGIKERIHMADPDTSLKPLSDNIQKMLSKKGFENLNRCTLDVPVAGHVNSRADSFDEHSKNSPKPQQNERASAGIAKNLAKVGRWWFSKCYEASTQSSSIWDNGALVAECQARETGFKLLLCYAQKPMQKRRTRSF
ncbi:MAG: hypothetical protein Q9163_002544 [Psora crenata]